MILGPGCALLLPPKTGSSYVVRECAGIGWRAPHSQHDRRCWHSPPAGFQLYSTRRNPVAWYESLYRYMHQYPAGQGCLRGLVVQAPFRPWLMSLMRDPVTRDVGPLQYEVMTGMRRLGVGLATYRVMQVTLPVEIDSVTEAWLPDDVSWIRTESLTEDLTAVWREHGVEATPKLGRVKVTRPRADIVWDDEMLEVVRKRDALLW